MGTEFKNNRIKALIFSVIGAVLVIAAIVLLILFFIRGETTTSGGFPDDEVTVSTTCTSKIVNYPLFTSEGAKKKELNVKVVAKKDRIDTVSLVYKLYFDSEDDRRANRDRNHYDMNKHFSDDKMEADSLGATYSMLSDSFKFTLFAEANDLNDTTLKYFMLDDLKGKGEYPYSSIKKIYQSKGLNCTENN